MLMMAICYYPSYPELDFMIQFQIMLNISLALIESLIAAMHTGGVFPIATMVNFITLTGIASRNGMMISICW